MKRLSKGRAFWAGLASILVIVALAAWRAPDSLAAVSGDGMFAIVGLVIAFSGANVADNYQRAKNYRPELDKGGS